MTNDRKDSYLHGSSCWLGCLHGFMGFSILCSKSSTGPGVRGLFRDQSVDVCLFKGLGILKNLYSMGVLYRALSLSLYI